MATIRRTVSSDMVRFDSEKFRADLVQVKPKNCTFAMIAKTLGHDSTYLSACLGNHRMSKKEFEMLCGLYGLDPEGYPPKVEEPGSEPAQEKKVVPGVDFTPIYQYVDMQKKEIAAGLKEFVENAFLSLLAEHEQKTNEKIAEVNLKRDRDMAEMRKMITSLQVQIEQAKNGRRTE